MSKIKTILTVCNQSTALEMIKQKIADKYIFICAKKIKQTQLPSGYIIGKNVISYSHLSLKRGKYFPKMDWTKVKPLDGTLIIRMRDCEATTMRMVERIPCIRKTYETRKKYYYDNLRYWAHVLKYQNVDFFYRCAPPHEGYDNVISGLCDEFNIPTLYFNPFHPGKAYFARFINDQMPFIESEYLLDLNNNNLYDNTKLSPELNKFFMEHLNKKQPSSLPTIIPRKKIRTQKTLLKRNASILKYIDTKAVIPELRKLKNNYIYVPLQYQYEATTCPMGGPFVDQILLLEILSRLNIKIYVKEHPRISKNRSMDYYVKIAGLRNVQFVKRNTNNYDLIDNCLCVASVTGTAGWEAILRGKQALVFGSIYHGYAPGGYFVRNFEDCQNAMKEIKDFKFDEYKLKVFLFTLEKYLFNHNVVDIVKALKRNIDNITEFNLLNEMDKPCNCGCSELQELPELIESCVEDEENN